MKAKTLSLGCRRTIELELKGDYVSGAVAADGTGSFALLVRKASRKGRALVAKQVTIQTDRRTKVRKGGKRSLAALAAGDRLEVEARACKGADVSTAMLLAKKVSAKRPKRGTTTTGTTATTTTGTTTTTP